MQLKEIIDSGKPVTPFHFLAVREDGLSFGACVEETWNAGDFLERFDKLHGTSLSGSCTPLEKLIDEATGKNLEDFQIFLRFVWNVVFLRCPELS